jgi:hypothetical protein
MSCVSTFNAHTTKELVGKPYEMNDLAENRRRRIKRFKTSLIRLENVAHKQKHIVNFSGLR